MDDSVTPGNNDTDKLLAAVSTVLNESESPPTHGLSRQQLAEFIAREAKQVAEKVNGHNGGRAWSAYLSEPSTIFWMVADVSTEEGQNKVINALNEYLGTVDVPKAWNSFQQERAEQARQKIHDRLLDKYGPGLRTFRRNEASEDIATVLRESQGPPPATWGEHHKVLWSKGEALLIAAGIGAGKTTLAGLLVRALLFGGDVLGQPVATLAPGSKVLYLALDRPDQIKRSLARQFTAGQLDALADRLVLWRGSLPADAAENPDILKDIADYYDNVAVVIVDSLKDVAIGLSEDRVGAGYNEARKRLLDSGRELVELHHLTKGGDDYGSVWLNAGAGSVIRLSGKPGAKLGTMTHTKQPAHPVGPLKIAHDHDRGEITLRTKDATATTEAESEDDIVSRLPEWVSGEGGEGVTAADAALFLYGSDGPTERERARYALEKHTGEDGGLYRVPGTRGGNGATRQPSRWVAVDE
jgi:hypothetical protein